MESDVQKYFTIFNIKSIKINTFYINFNKYISIVKKYYYIYNKKNTKKKKLNAGVKGLEPSTPGFGDQYSTN